MEAVVLVVLVLVGSVVVVAAALAAEASAILVDLIGSQRLVVLPASVMVVVTVVALAVDLGLVVEQVGAMGWLELALAVGEAVPASLFARLAGSKK